MWHLTPDMWQVTHDTWHMTPDAWLVVNVVSKFQVSNSNGLGVIVFWRLGVKEWLIHFMKVVVERPCIIETTQPVKNKDATALYY